MNHQVPWCLNSIHLTGRLVDEGLIVVNSKHTLKQVVNSQGSFFFKKNSQGSLNTYKATIQLLP